MSQENVDIVRQLFRAFEGGFDLDAASEFWHPEISWRAIEGALDDVGEMRGQAALRHYYEQWVDTFDSIEATAEEILDAGDAVVVAGRVTGQMKESHAQVEMRLGIVYTLSSGKIIRGREYATHAEALAAAGLSE